MTKHNRFSAAIFDLDGLMLDTETVSYEAWKRAMAEYGLVLDDKTYHKIIGLVVEDMRDIFCGTYGSDFPLEKINEKRIEYMHQHYDKYGIGIKDGLFQLLDFLDEKGLHKAVATSSCSLTAKRKLTQSNLLSRFDCIVCGDDVEKGKPAPDIFLAAAEKLNTPPPNCIVFEDSENGVIAADRAGMTVIMIPDVKQPNEQVASLAHKIFSSLSQVIPYLEEVMSET